MTQPGAIHMARSIIHLSEGKYGNKGPNRSGVSHGRNSYPANRSRGSRDRMRTQEGRNEELSSIPEKGIDRRKILMAVIIASSVLLAGLLTFRMMGIVENNGSNNQEPFLQDTFIGGSEQVLLNTTFLGTDAFFEIPSGADIQQASLTISGSLPPQRLTFQAGRNPSDIAVGDINGDLFSDVLVANYKDSNLMIMRHDGERLVQGQAYATGEGPIKVVLENFDDHPLPDAGFIDRFR